MHGGARTAPNERNNATGLNDAGRCFSPSALSQWITGQGAFSRRINGDPHAEGTQYAVPGGSLEKPVNFATKGNIRSLKTPGMQ